MSSVLPGLLQQSPEAAGRRRGAAFPEPLAWQPVPTRHQREPVKPVCCRNVISVWTCPISVPHWTRMSIRSPSLHRCVCRIETMVISYKSGPQPPSSEHSLRFRCISSWIPLSPGYTNGALWRGQIHRLASAGPFCHMTAQNSFQL